MTDFAVPVDTGHILTFARALSDPNPAYSPVDGAGVWRSSGVLAPPTFALVADQFDPEFPRRPRPGNRWPESMFPPEAGDDPTKGQPFHVEQRFDYRRHLLDDSGAPAVTTTWLDVRTETSHASLTTTGAPSPPQPVDEAPVIVLAEALTRTQFVMYAAAAGDFHPLHHDDAYARQHGYPSVFAPGMLTMGLTGRAVTEVVGDGVLTQFRGRLNAQVWPGDTLTATVVPVRRPEGGPSSVQEVVVRTYNQRGEVVFDGSATARSR